jgi:UDP-N-acetylmuramoylalanine-D-glutamate ligase
MSAVKKKKAKAKAAAKPKAGEKDLVLGLGATGLSVARYLKRTGRKAVFLDSREEPPGLEELDEFWPDAERELGSSELPANVGRVIASPGIADNDPLVEATTIRSSRRHAMRGSKSFRISSCSRVKRRLHSLV